MVQHPSLRLHLYLRQAPAHPKCSKLTFFRPALGKQLTLNLCIVDCLNTAAAVTLEFTISTNNKRESNGHIPSHKLAVSKITYMCIWLETAGSVITANYMLITWLYYSNYFTCKLLIVAHQQQHILQQEIFSYRQQLVTHLCTWQAADFVWHRSSGRLPQTLMWNM